MTVLEAYSGRLAIEATMKPSCAVGRNQGSKIPDERGWSGRPGSIGQCIGTGRFLFTRCPLTTTPDNTRLLHGEGGVVFYLTGGMRKALPHI